MTMQAVLHTEIRVLDCAVCSGVFVTPRRPGRPASVCSNRCRNRRSVAWAIARTGARHRGDRAAQRRRRAERLPDEAAQIRRTRRARQRAVAIGARFSIDDVIARDGTDCHLCGLPVDVELRGRTRWSRSMDHVVPIARGGRHELANCRLAHYGCNSRKRDRMLV